MKGKEYISEKERQEMVSGMYGQVAAVPTVNIPLDEYRNYIEYKIKGPTVEIPLEEYDSMRSKIDSLMKETDNRRMENEYLKKELDRRETVEKILDSYGRTIEKAMQNVKFDLINRMDRMKEK